MAWNYGNYVIDMMANYCPFFKQADCFRCSSGIFGVYKDWKRKKRKKKKSKHQTKTTYLSSSQEKPRFCISDLLSYFMISTNFLSICLILSRSVDAIRFRISKFNLLLNSIRRFFSFFSYCSLDKTRRFLFVSITQKFNITACLICDP